VHREERKQSQDNEGFRELRKSAEADLLPDRLAGLNASVPEKLHGLEHLGARVLPT